MTDKKVNPKTAKGSMRKIEVCCASWIDLLGYGSMLKEAEFDPTHDSSNEAVERAEKFHDAVANISCRYFPIFTMNDGAVAYRDMSPRASSVTFDFLSRSLGLFAEVNRVDQKVLGHPGARMVVAAGFRVRRELDFDGLLNQGKGKRIKEKLAEGSIDQNQAINEALKVRNYVDSIPELQANFAMSKAYIAEDSGSSTGLSGPSCFVDLSMFSTELPDWISFSEFIDWKKAGLAARFGRFSEIDNKMAGALSHDGMLDAYGIAKAIGTSSDVVDRLNDSRLGNFR